MLGPDSALGPLIAAAILPLVGAHGDPATAIALAGMLALLMGVICIAAGLARLGVVAELFSKPVRIGFLNGIALVVLVSQLPTLFGFRTDADGFVDQTRAFVQSLVDGATVPAALAVGAACLAVIVVVHRLWPSGPGILIAVIGSVVATVVLGLADRGVTMVGSIPEGFPTPSFPGVSLHDTATLLVAATGMAFVVLADTTVLSRSVAALHHEEADANAEIVALGTANLAAGLLQGFPVSASTSRTAVASTTGWRTQAAGVFAAVAIVVVLVADGGLGRNLPSTTLAAIVITAAVMLFDLAGMRWLWRVRRAEFLLCLAALLGVTLIGVLQGIVVAVVLSLGDFVRRQWRPHDAVLGRIAGRKGYHDTERHPDAAQIPGLVVYRFDAPLFFANAELFGQRVRGAVDGRADPVRWVVVAAEPMTDVDTTGAEVLGDLLDDLRDRGVTLTFAELKGPVKDQLRSYALYDRIGDAHFFPTLGTAVDRYLSTTGTHWTDWTDDPRPEGRADGDDGP